MVQGMPNHIDKFGWVNAELKCDQEPSTMEIARVLASRCKTTVLTGSANTTRIVGQSRRGERANFASTRTTSSTTSTAQLDDTSPFFGVQIVPKSKVTDEQHWKIDETVSTTRNWCSVEQFACSETIRYVPRLTQTECMLAKTRQTE